MGLTATLAARIAATRYENLSETAIAAAQRLVLDGIAVAVAGTHEQGIRILAAHERGLGGTPESTAIGFGFRIDPVRAAALNGAAMHVLDFEPMWSPATHALSTTLPVALALAEAHGLAGREVLTALIKGIEIQGRLREASGQFVPEQLQFHPPGLVGPMGAAVAAAHLLMLDGKQLQHALGIAASRAGSVFSNAGTMTKSTHCGQAAALGLDAAMLAARGFTGDADTFELGAGFRRNVPQGYVPTGRAGKIWPALACRRPRLRDKNVSQPVRHAFRHHRRVGAASTDRRSGCDTSCDADRPGDAVCEPAGTGDWIVRQIQLPVCACCGVTGWQGGHQHVHRCHAAPAGPTVRCWERSRSGWTRISRLDSKPCMSRQQSK